MAQYSAQLDGVFVALADPTRRGVIRRLGRGPTSVGDLAREFPMTLPSFMKHVRTLESNGLIRTAKSGRVRTCVLNRERLALVDDWLAEQRRIWEERTDRLERLVTDPKENQPMNPDLDLTLQRVIRAPRAAVWSAWTDPSRFEKWWVPAPTLCRVDRLEVRPGGALVTRLSDDGVEFVPHLDASFLVVDELERIVFTNAIDSAWRPANPAPVADDRRDHPERSSGRHGLPGRRPPRRPRRPRPSRGTRLRRRLGLGHQATRRGR